MATNYHPLKNYNLYFNSENPEMAIFLLRGGSNTFEFIAVGDVRTLLIIYLKTNAAISIFVQITLRLLFQFA